MRILITGAQGFVGCYLIHRALHSRPDAEILGIGRSPQADGYFSHDVTVQGMRVRARVPETLRGPRDIRYQYQQIDLDDTAALRRIADRFQPDSVVHLASGLRGDYWRALVQTNVTGTASLLTALGETCQRPPAVVIASTGGVYGAIAPEDLPVLEAAPANPADVYSATKLAAEQISRVLCAEYGMRLAVARLFNIVGPGQSERHVCGRFASAIAEAATHSNPTVRTGCLTSTRDYVDVRDAASALLVLTESGTGPYNVASGIETSTDTMLRLLSRHAGLEGKLQIDATEPTLPGVSRHAGCAERLTALGYTPAFTLEKSLSDVFDYYVAYRRPNRPFATRIPAPEHTASERAPTR